MSEPSTPTPAPVRRRIGDPGGSDTPTGHGGDHLRSITDRRPVPPATSASTTSAPTVDAPAPVEATPADETPVDQPVVDRTSDRPVVDSTTPPVADEAVANGRTRWLSLWRVVSAVLLVILIVVAVLAGLKIQSQNNTNSLRSSALRTAKADGVLLSSYDYQNLTAPGSAWSKVEKDATPSFRKSFLSTSGSLSKLLTQYHATATGKVINAGVASFSTKRAVVLLFIDQTVNNTVQKSSRSTQPLRSELTLVRSGGKWQIGNLQVPK